MTAALIFIVVIVPHVVGLIRHLSKISQRK